jgi:uncharacterized protein
MNRNQVLPQVELSADLGALRKVDLSAHLAYKGHGFLSIQDLPRVAQEAASVENGDGFDWSVATHFEESLGSEPRHIMDVELKGRIHLLCQRCLKECPNELTQKSRFVLVGSEAEADSFPIEDDLQEPLVASQHFDVLELLEDEVLLSLPLIPRHTDGACQAQEATFADKSRESDPLEKPLNPFNILKNMKKNS